MSGQMQLADAYDLVYSAAARMMWTQKSRVWRLDSPGGGWPEERREAWRELEAALAHSEGPRPQAGEPSDPVRHLVSRRAVGPVDRPVTFAEAVAEWTARLVQDPGPYESRTEPYPDDYMVPGRTVVIPEGHMMVLTSPLDDLVHRLAPGRPSVTISGVTTELSRLLHGAADELREAAGAPVPTPHPVGTIDVAQVSHRPSDVEDLPGRYETMSRAAWRAAEGIPTVEEMRESMDFAVNPEVAKAAEVLQSLLTGKSGVFWQEQHESIDPSTHAVSGVDWPEGRPVPAPLAAEAEGFTRSVTLGRKPRKPHENERRIFREKGNPDHVAISAVRAVILAEILDEYAARIHPGARSGVMHLSAYDLTDFITEGIGRELRETYGF
ncbi:hypothetical protein ACFY4I_02805 [Streptomyces scabiei]|uniref:hypothetical protein n=1 Tax=Streptomyces scabiei TaxID=1930 RepID=UPI003681F725